MNKQFKAKNLTVKSFRGISKEQTLDFKDITIVYGTNGMGKSSFINSLEYLFTNKLSFLNKSTIKKNKVPIHKNFSKKDVKIELDFDNGEHMSLKSHSDGFDEILENLYVKNASFILNRSKLLQFIDGTQGKRYDAIIELCGIKDLNKIESTFSSSTSTLKKELSSTESRYNESLAEFSQLLFGDTLSDYDECINKLNSILKDNGKKTIDNDTDIDEFINNLDMSQFTLIKNKIDEFKDISNAFEYKNITSCLKDIIDDYQNLASNNLKSSQYLLNVLNETIPFLEYTDCDTCPICNNSIDSNQTIVEIKERITEISQSNNSFNQWKTKINQLILLVENQNMVCEKLDENYNEFINLTGISKVEFNYNSLINLKNDLNDFLNLKKVITDFGSYNLDELSEMINLINQEIIEYENNHNIDEMSDIYNALFKVKEIKWFEINIKKLIKQYSVAERAFEIFKQTKEEFINNIMHEIRDDVKYFYEYIHEDDIINNPDIVLTDSKKIDVYLDSFGDVVDSRSYASEGHLDTLGICIFLAFNKMFNELPLIVLDDVFTTVDVYHKDKIANLIINDLSDYQFFITTHNVPWANQLKKMCQSYNKEYLLYEITDWSFEDGPVIEIKSADDFINEKERKIAIKNISDKLKDDASSIDDVFSDMDNLM